MGKSKKKVQETKHEKKRLKETKHEKKSVTNPRLPGFQVEDYVYSPFQNPKLDGNIDKKREKRLCAPKVIMILEGAALELHSEQKVGKVKGFFLLDGMKHKKEFKNREDGDDGKDHRPDILHHCLSFLQSSPLNRTGLLAVYIRTKDKQLIEISPQLKVPSCYDEFEAMLTNVMLKKTIKGKPSDKGGRQTLVRFVKNDLDEILPIGKEFYGLSVNGTDIEGDLTKWASTKFTHTPSAHTSGPDVIEKAIELHPRPIVMVVGAVAKSDPVNTSTYPEAELVRISKHPLTASQCIIKLCHAFETAWRIV